MNENDLNPDILTKEPAIPEECHYENKIPVLDKSQTSYEDFFENYMLKNQPCIIKNVGQEWPAYKDWLNSTKTDLNYKHMFKYGLDEVPVYDLKAKYFNSHKSQSVPFSQYLIYWESYIKSYYSPEFPLLYLKDWHFRRHFPNDIFYEVPKYFQSDWLNEYLVNEDKDDYRFVYMGPKGTWTPLHADVFKSYSWSVNVFGRKRWILIPPGEENKLKDSFGNMPLEVNFGSDGSDFFTHFNIVQETGDAIFVPSGWHHQVWNVKDTISVNHNWINGCNIKTVLLDMERHLETVKREIADCKYDADFVQQCQLVLKASHGMDFLELFEFIEYIALKRLQTVLKSHDIFDLKQIRSTLEHLLNIEDARSLCFYKDGLDLDENIRKNLEKKPQN